MGFTLGREKLGIVGESGSGKSMTGRAILRLVGPPGRAQADRLVFDGIDLQRQSERQMRAIRGRRISMVMQDPKFSLNPVMTVGRAGRRGLPHPQARLGPRGQAAGAGDARGGAHPRPGAGVRACIRTRSRAAWASAS